MSTLQGFDFFQGKQT